MEQSTKWYRAKYGEHEVFDFFVQFIITTDVPLTETQ